MARNKRFRRAFQLQRPGALTAMIGWVLLASCGPQDVQLYRQAEKLWRNAEYQKAVEAFQNVAELHPESPLAADALREAAAIASLQLNNPAKALKLYQAFLERYPRSEHRLQALSRVADLYENEIGDLRKALAAHQQLARLSFDEKEQMQHRLAVANCYFKLNEFDRALFDYQKLIDDGAGGHLREQAQLKVGTLLQMRRRYHAALEPFKEVLQTTACSECKLQAQLGLVECYDALQEYGEGDRVAREILDPQIRSRMVRRFQRP